MLHHINGSCTVVATSTTPLLVTSPVTTITGQTNANTEGTTKTTTQTGMSGIQALAAAAAATQKVAVPQTAQIKIGRIIVFYKMLLFS